MQLALLTSLRSTQPFNDTLQHVMTRQGICGVGVEITRPRARKWAHRRNIIHRRFRVHSRKPLKVSFCLPRKTREIGLISSAFSIPPYPQTNECFVGAKQDYAAAGFNFAGISPSDVAPAPERGCFDSWTHSASRVIRLTLDKTSSR